MSMTTPPFGASLRLLRKELHLSQEALAAAVGTTQRHVSFLETGRSAPTRDMLARIATGLGLSPPQRASLFEASGFRNPFPHRRLDQAELVDLLDLLSCHVLRHWPFPAFVLDRDWTFLRWNAAGQGMLAMFDHPANMHTMFLSPTFRAVIQNWEEASSGLYYRLKETARSSPEVGAAFESAVADGLFEHVTRRLAATDEVPVYVPIVIELPNAMRLKITTMSGRLTSVHDAVADGFGVELLVPLDRSTEPSLRALFGDATQGA